MSTILEEAYDFYKRQARVIAGEIIKQKLFMERKTGYVVNYMSVRKTCVIARVFVLGSKGYEKRTMTVTAKEIDQYIEYAQDETNTVPVPGV